MGTTKMSNTTSFKKLWYAVKGMALPKHPHSNTHWLAISTTAPDASTISLVPNGSHVAVYQVSHVKNTIMTVVNTDVNLGSAPTRMAMPSKISAMHTNTANSNAQGPRNSRFMAPGSKYSSSLYMNPKASLDLINPDTTNSAPTNTRDTQVNPSNAFNIPSTVGLHRNSF